MNKENLRFLIIGLLLGAFTIRSAEVSWSSYQLTMKQISSVDGVFETVTLCVTASNSSVTAVVSEASNGTRALEKAVSQLTVAQKGVNITADRSAGWATTSENIREAKVEVLKNTEATNQSTTIGVGGSVGGSFKRYPGVVIAVKVHGGAFIPELKQSFCLLHAAYNNRVLYDILVFATDTLPRDGLAELRQIVHPARIIVQYDTKTLQDHIAEMTPEQQKHLLERTNDANTTADITWHHRVREGRFVMPIAYCWMSEFRSKHIWKQKVLEPYKYMLWYDSDAFATQVWRQDPVDFMVKNDLVLLTANYAQGKTSFSSGVQSKIYEVYNKTFCDGQIMKNGMLNVTYGGQYGCKNGVKQVHGFFHITNLDFYREPLNMHWYDVQIGDLRFSRKWDDQLAVATPATMVAPERTMEMEASGLKLEVMHNGMIMGKRKWMGGAYKAFFRTEGKTKFPEAQDKCKPYIKVPSR